MKFPMSGQDSESIANQLDPVKLRLPEQTGKRPGYDDFFRPRINVDPWFLMTQLRPHKMIWVM